MTTTIDLLGQPEDTVALFLGFATVRVRLGVLGGSSCGAYVVEVDNPDGATVPDSCSEWWSRGEDRADFHAACAVAASYAADIFDANA